MPPVKDVGEPCAGEPHARIDAAAGGNRNQSGRHEPHGTRRLPPTRPSAGARLRRPHLEQCESKGSAVVRGGNAVVPRGGARLGRRRPRACTAAYSPSVDLIISSARTGSVAGDVYGCAARASRGCSREAARVDGGRPIVVPVGRHEKAASNRAPTARSPSSAGPPRDRPRSGTRTSSRRPWSAPLAGAGARRAAAPARRSGPGR
jgi:hypothetical protein